MAYKLNDHGYRVSQYLKEKNEIIVLKGSISLSSVIVLCCPKVFHYGEEIKYFVSSLELNNKQSSTLGKTQRGVALKEVKQ